MWILPLSDHSPVEEVHLPGQSGDSGFIQSKSVGAPKHPISRSELKRLSATDRDGGVCEEASEAVPRRDRRALQAHGS
jgi:hypothetical protein